jgi:hypothetical protein
MNTKKFGGLHLNSQLLTYQILTKDDQILILKISCFITTVAYLPKISEDQQKLSILLRTSYPHVPISSGGPKELRAERKFWARLRPETATLKSRTQFYVRFDRIFSGQ